MLTPGDRADRLTRGPHVREHFSHHLRQFWAVCVEPYPFWNCKSNFRILLTLQSDIPQRNSMLASGTSRRQLYRFSHLLHIIRWFYGSVSSMFSCFKHATSFFQPLNSLLNISVCIRNSVVALKTLAEKFFVSWPQNFCFRNLPAERVLDVLL